MQQKKGVKMRASNELIKQSATRLTDAAINSELKVTVNVNTVDNWFWVSINKGLFACVQFDENIVQETTNAIKLIKKANQL
jgi:hypothetical protein